MAQTLTSPNRVVASMGPPPGVRRRRRNSALSALGFSAPALLLVGAFFYVPLALLVWMSLKNWPLLGNTSFAGAQNYTELASDKTFRDAIGMTLRFTVITVPLQLLGGYVLAALVRESRCGVALFRTVFFLPVVVGFATVSYLFVIMMQPGTGVVSSVTHALGLTSDNPPWLTDPGLATAWIALMTAWKTVGTGMILFMAGMQSINPELYEAAAMDGAGTLRRELSITVPLLRRTFALVILLSVTASLLTFDQFFIITHGGPANATMTAVMWMYTTSFIRYRLGYGAAMAISILVILVVLSLAQMLLLRERHDDE